MKTKAILLFALSLVMTVFMTSCGDDAEETVLATGMSMNVDSLDVEMQGVGTLVATLEPTGATGDITWSSSDVSVAVVVNGIVTGISIGEATIVASHGVYSTSAVVTVIPEAIDPDDLPEALNGSNYHLIAIDETSYNFISDKVDNDFRPDNENTNLYIWDNTFSAGSSAGLNYFGQAEEWVSLVVASVGWSGAGYNVGEGYGSVDMTDLAANPDDYVFHVAMKGSGTASYLFILTDGVVEVKLAIGSSNYVDGDISYAPYADFTRDNEWHSIEVPVSDLIALGLNFDTTFTNKNILSFLAGGVGGTTMDMDAIFYYKK